MDLHERAARSVELVSSPRKMASAPAFLAAWQLAVKSGWASDACARYTRFRPYFGASVGPREYAAEHSAASTQVSVPNLLWARPWTSATAEKIAAKSSTPDVPCGKNIGFSYAHCSAMEVPI